MKKKRQNFKRQNFKLSADEGRIEAEIENGDWTSAADKEINRIRSQMVDAAQSRGRYVRVSLQLNYNDVEKLRLKAKREGVTYQTLIRSILHKYATDQLIEEKAVEVVMWKLGKKARG